MKNRKKEKNNKTSFFKMEATGNDFIFIDQRTIDFKRIGSGQRVQLVKKICDRHRGLGADGVVFLERPLKSAADLRWDFYNSDGSRAEMCGNAARAVGHLVFDFEKRKKSLRLETQAGVIVIRKIALGQYGATLPPVSFLKGPMVQTFLGKSILYVLVNSGVPHAVVPLNKKLSKTKLGEMAVALKKSGRLGRGGANVTFFWKNKKGIEDITHERGVEDFTLSCGTGALAAAWVAECVLGFRSSGRVTLPGGEIVVVFRERPELIGSATMIARGTLCRN